MLIFNCTKAAAEFFTKTKQGKKLTAMEAAPHKTIAGSIAESKSFPQWQWLVHAIKVKNANVLVVMDYQTRFCITLSTLTKGDDANFLNMLEHHLRVHIHEMMADVDISEPLIDTSIEHYMHQHTSRAFYQRGDRSVQAHINDVAWHFRNAADDNGEVLAGVDLIGFDAFANSLLRQGMDKKTYFYPQQEFLRGWLKHNGEHSADQANECIERLQAKKLAGFAAHHPELHHPTEHKTPLVLADTDSKLSSNVISLDAYRKK